MEIKLIIKTAGKTISAEPKSVQVKEQLKQPISFTLTYGDDICDGDFKMVEDSSFDPFKEIEIWISIDGKKHCLLKGLVQSQQIKMEHGGEGSQLQVTGVDNSVRLSWVTETRNWGKEMNRDNIYTLLTKVQKTKKDKAVDQFEFDEYRIMGKTLLKGGMPKVDVKQTKPGETEIKEELPPPPPPVEGQDFLKFAEPQLQRQDDLGFIRRIAEQKGLYFWISYAEGDKGEQVAHFEKLPLHDISGQDFLRDPAAMTLHLNREFADLDEFNISWDADRPTSVQAIHTDRATRKDHENKIEQAPQPKLGNKTLTDMTGFLLEAFQTVPVSNAKDMKDRNEAALNEAEWFIKANCSTSYDKLCKNKDMSGSVYGKILHAHTIINIDGAGSKHSGAYLVSGVTHNISPGAYKIDLELIRNAWVDKNKVKSNTSTQPATAVAG